MEVGTGGFTNSSPAQGPVAGIDTKLFKGEDDLLLAKAVTEFFDFI